MSYYSIEQWTVKDVASAFSSVEGDSSNRKVVIPIFQRGMRWADERRAGFIDSLHRGYPFGSLLFAKQPGPNTYSVVDGLQRGSTVCNFVFNPLGKNNITNIDDDILTTVRKVLLPDNEVHAVNNKIQEIILTYFYEKKTFDEVDMFELTRRIMQNIPTMQDPFICASAINNAIRLFFNQKKQEYEDICSAVVPIVVYSGPSELLSEIFRRINREGIPLDDYEIYAAVWIQEKRAVNTQEIVQKVVDKYLVLCKNGFVLCDFELRLC